MKHQKVVRQFLPVCLILAQLLFFTGTSVAQTTEDTSSVKTNENKQNEETTAGTKAFVGLNWGVGVSLTHDLGHHSRIESASVVNGFVRVDKERNDIARVMLELHYFFTPNKKFLFINSIGYEEWGWGPFVAVQPGEKEVIQAIAFGVMLGFRKNTITTKSWNIGIGAVVDPSVKVLGDGLEVNAPLPAGENEKEVRLQDKSQWGVVVLTSFSF